MRKKSKQQDLGQFMTPLPVAEKMAAFVKAPVKDWVVLDPSCGDGNLLVAAAIAMLNHGLTDVADRLIGYDIDADMVSRAKERLSALLACSASSIKCYHGDFLEVSEGGLFSAAESELQLVNIVLSNPPYGLGREYVFFDRTSSVFQENTELVFLVPLAFIDRVKGVQYEALDGRPLGVTTGHAIVYHLAGRHYSFRSAKELQRNPTRFVVSSGIKIYEVGAGSPPQSKELVAARTYCASEPREGWLPCLRTGDVTNSGVVTGRLWVKYGPHLAHPKEIGRFSGPKLFVRRIPSYADGTLIAAYSDSTILCAGDVLVIRHESDDPDMLQRLRLYLGSREAADFLIANRPSLQYRMSYPKISAKDLNALLHHLSQSDRSHQLKNDKSNNQR